MFRPLLAITAIASLAACSMPSFEASVEREAQAQTLLEDLAAGRDDLILGQLTAGSDEAGFRAQLPSIKSLIPTGPVPGGTTLAWRANAGTAGQTYALRRSYAYPDRTLTVDSIFLKEKEVWKIAGFHVAPTMTAPSEATAEGDPLIEVAPQVPPSSAGS